jgi:hypothetical protein
MKKSVLLLLCLIIAAPTYAGTTYVWENDGDSMTVDIVAEVQVKNIIGNSGGGPFRLELVSGTLGGYEGPSYCLESEVKVDYNVTYLASLSDTAYGGGVAGVAGDRLSDVAEYIYKQNWMKDIGDIDAEEISQSIYYAEEELKGVKGASYEAAALALYGDADQDPSALNGSSAGVAVLNLWAVKDMVQTDNGLIIYLDDIQSQIVGVPAPGAVLLGGLGTCLVGFVRRRFMA